MQVVESVIHLRRSGDLRDSHAHDIAASCLRLIGLTAPEVTRARDAAGQAPRRGATAAGQPVIRIGTLTGRQPARGRRSAALPACPPPGLPRPPR